MPDFENTPEQELAIKTHGRTLLVSAGAGSGKTRVLTDRLMHYICDEDDPKDISTFLIITYTKAAAAELRGRIMKRLAELTDENGDDPELCSRLNRQRALLPSTQISTIHSFCSRLLREYASSSEIDIPAGFSVLDEDRKKGMMANALDKTLNEFHETPKAHNGFIHLSDTVGGGRDDSRLARLVLDLYEKMQCHARPEEWARKQIDNLRASALCAEDSVWLKEIMNCAREMTADALEGINSVIDDAEWKNPKYGATIGVAVNETRERLMTANHILCTGEEGKALLSEKWNLLHGLLPEITGTHVRFSSAKKGMDQDFIGRAKEMRDRGKDALEELKVYFSADVETALREQQEMAPAMEALLELTLAFGRKYAADKYSKNLLDYSDLEHLTVKMLLNEDDSPNELARRIASRYTEIMVDEYQDVSRVQDMLFRTIARHDGEAEAGGPGTNLFMVGDIKQSIYGFRLADPKIFAAKEQSFGKDAAAGTGEPLLIILRENFRSRKEILKAANSVFLKTMRTDFGGQDYNKDTELKYGAKDTYGGDDFEKPRIILIKKNSGAAADDENDTDDDSGLYLEARFVADKIAEMVAAGTEIIKDGRAQPLDYSDIAIILRSPNYDGEKFREALASRGIPVRASLAGSFFTAPEIEILTAALRITDNPYRDVDMLAALRSPAFCFSDEQLAIIRSEGAEGCLYESVRSMKDRDPKCEAFLETLEELRAVSAELPVGELVWEIINRLDILALCSAMSGGEGRLENIMNFAELAEQYENSGYKGLHRFIGWLETKEANNEDPPAAGAGSAVTIMSAHKSKGLEFPVVFFCRTDKQYNTDDSSKLVLIHPDLGLGPKYTDLDRVVSYPTAARLAIKSRMLKESREEELRLLYVIMTRAKERLYITGTVGDIDKLVKDSNAAALKINRFKLQRLSSPLKLLMCCGCADGWQNIELTVYDEAEKQKTAGKAAAGGIQADEGFRQELERRLSFEYAHPEAESLPSKITATEMKGFTEKDPDADTLIKEHHYEFEMPDFAKKDGKIGGAARGTLTHLVLQKIDLNKTGSLAEIRGELDRLVEKGFLKENEAAAVNAKALEKFFGSETGLRIKNAGTVYREFKFSLLYDADKVFDTVEREQLLLQGVVDCLIIEDGKISIIDYKTDRVENDAELQEKARFYKGQVMAYKNAAERIFGLPVKECILYFLGPGEEVKFS